eukprot:TRINITY_DN4831_c0_g1_i1.p2 TRINITY_DN4831_c0_g1~~TRINITY_DN4831_c0_g1_i1.p2  ORF type:complete len:247 (+),score=35.16 TRINITY_DN4831_c0_g1_i1:66-806(+)
MNEKNERNEMEILSMKNTDYKEWFVENWNTKGGLISQAMASKILQKTPTRIRQMINENKLNSFTFEDETPLVSFAETMQIYENEYKKLLEMEEAISDAINNGYKPDDEYLIEDEQIMYDEDLSDIPEEVLEIIKQEKINLKEEKKKLQKQIEELQEKLLSLSSKSQKARQIAQTINCGFLQTFVNSLKSVLQFGSARLEELQTFYFLQYQTFHSMLIFSLYFFLHKQVEELQEKLFAQAQKNKSGS